MNLSIHEDFFFNHVQCCSAVDLVRRLCKYICMTDPSGAAIDSKSAPKNFMRSQNHVLKTTQRTLNILTKRKARPKDNGDPPSLKEGRPTKAYSVSDAVDMVS
jgi:hypothetical protein